MSDTDGTANEPPEQTPRAKFIARHVGACNTEPALALLWDRSSELEEDLATLEPDADPAVSLAWVALIVVDYVLADALEGDLARGVLVERACSADVFEKREANRIVQDAFDSWRAIMEVQHEYRLERELEDNERRHVELIRELGKSSASASRVGRVLGADEIFAPLPPVPWLCEELEIAPDGVSLLAGFSFSAKTMLAQSLAIAVADRSAKQRAFGRFVVRHGRVIHFDFEQGFRLTAARYQKLARGAGLWGDDLDLQLICRPKTYLDSSNAEGWFGEMCFGCALAIIDPLRSAAPKMDENSSSARIPLDMLARVSERTQCSILLLHHARKPGENDAGGARMSVRGTSGFHDASQAVLLASGDPRGEKILSLEKAKISGQLGEPMLIEIEDVKIKTADGPGLVVRLVDGPKTTAPSAQTELVRQFIALVRRRPGIGSKDAAKELKRNGKVISAAAKTAIGLGLVEDRGTGNAHKFHIAEPAEGVQTPCANSEAEGDSVSQTCPAQKPGVSRGV